MEEQRESIDFDVIVVGGGPAGLAAAIRIRQIAAKEGRDIDVCVIEKGSEIGAHILSGAVFEPRALEELFPDWRALGAPLNTPVSADEMLYLSPGKSYRFPESLLLPQQKNSGNYIVSLGNLCRWLGQQAEALGVQLFTGFAAAEILYDDNGTVTGVVTGDMGVAQDNSRKDNYQPGHLLRAPYTLFAEGCRGHLGKQLMARFDLREGRDPQHYGLGLKELWEVPPAQHRPGLVIHTLGWPLDAATYGGSFIYHLEANQVAIGFVVGLNYRNPSLSPIEEFQRFKTHPAVAKHLHGGKRVAYGARAINEGGLQSLPKLSFPGGMLIGCDAGFLNLPKIKGSHTAMKSGMLAAEVVCRALGEGRLGADLAEIEQVFKHSWAFEELHRARNVYPAFHKWGMWGGLLFTGLDQHVFRGSLPLTLRARKPDHESLVPAKQTRRIDYPLPDGVLSFDQMSSIYLSNTHHQENQPCHLKLRDPQIPVNHNLVHYDEPAQRYCPAGVYEIVANESAEPMLQINSQNCIHCKACDIKDPTQNITWIAPEGGGGPNYPNM